MSDSFMGEVYFRVSQHLGIVMSEVIRKKFTPDMMLLIHKYSNIVRAELAEYKKLKEEEFELHWTKYDGGNSETKIYKEIIDIFSKYLLPYPDLCNQIKTAGVMNPLF